MDGTLLKQLNDARQGRKAVCVVRELASQKIRLVTSENAAQDKLGDELLARLKSGKSGIIVRDGEEIFIQVYSPPPRMIIIGAVHISQALAPMAKACNFEVSIIDPRTAFASKERFSDVTLHAEWPVDILQDNPLDGFTALVALTHDPKIDDIPIRAALDAGCFYIGALGSRKTHGKRVDRLVADGVQATALDQIYAPIGLNIGAANPAEIAVSVMAEIIQRLRMGETK